MSEDELISVLDDMMSFAKSALRVYEDTSLRAMLGLLLGRDVKLVPNPNLVVPASLRTAAERLSLEELHAVCGFVLHWFFVWAHESREPSSHTWSKWTEQRLNESKSQIASFLEAVPQLADTLCISDEKLVFRSEVDAHERHRIAGYVRRHHRLLIEV